MSGRAIQRRKTKTISAHQKINAIVRTIIWKTLMKKLIRRPRYHAGRTSE